MPFTNRIPINRTPDLHHTRRARGLAIAIEFKTFRAPIKATMAQIILRHLFRVGHQFLVRQIKKHTVLVGFEKRRHQFFIAPIIIRQITKIIRKPHRNGKGCGVNRKACRQRMAMRMQNWRIRKNPADQTNTGEIGRCFIGNKFNIRIIDPKRRQITFTNLTNGLFIKARHLFGHLACTKNFGHNPGKITDFTRSINIRMRAQNTLAQRRS